MTAWCIIWYDPCPDAMAFTDFKAARLIRKTIRISLPYSPHLTMSSGEFFGLYLVTYSARRSEASKVVPLTCHGHSRPVTHLSFSSVVDDDQYYLISACKGGDPISVAKSS